jgi:hypothetical protein
LVDDPRLYGAWHDSTGSLKVVDHETAELLRLLVEPRRATDAQADELSLARLVLDGLLQLEGAHGFAHGSQAFELICNPGWKPVATTETARLSIAALLYAQNLEVDDARRLSARLYFFGRVPASPGWLRRLPDRGAVERFLGMDDDGVARRLQRWRRMKPDPDNDGWMLWAARDVDPSAPSGDRFKLYISPRPGDSPAGFAAAVRVADDAGAVALKVAHDPVGLLRPDKIVVYLRDIESLEAAAKAAAELLAGHPGQGVPFTSELGDSRGLLSWGIDPPRSEQLVGWLERESWRLWLTNQLATSIIAARRDGCAVEPWVFAAARVHVEGVETSTWTPRRDPWADGS